jgi:hypothetical protein
MRLATRLACALFVLGALASTAHAQFQTPVRYNEGPGVKLTDSLVFHPGLAIEGRYDSNALLSDSSRAGAPYLRLIAHLNLTTTSPQRRTAGDGTVASSQVEFGLQSSFAYREYFSGDDDVTQQRALEISAGLNFRWTPSRYFNLEILDSYTRSVQARNFFVLPGSTARPNDTLSQNLNRLTARANIVPGGGRLSFGLGYSLNFSLFEDDRFDQANRFIHEVAFNGKFKLLPKTALTLDVTQQFTSYPSDPDNPADPGNQQDSKPFRVYAGFTGLFTPRLSVLIKVGYGNSIHDANESFSSVLAKVELGYAIAPTAKMKLGYERSFQDSQFANFYTDHRVYGGYDHLIAGRFVLHLDAAYSYRSFDGFPPSGISNVGSLDQNLLSGGLSFDYQIRDWVYVGIGYDLQLQGVSADNPNAPLVGVLDFTRHQVYAKVGISY